MLSFYVKVISIQYRLPQNLYKIFQKKLQPTIMRRYLLQILLVLITTVFAYGVQKLVQNEPDDPNTNTPSWKDTEGEFLYIVSLQEWSRGPNRIIHMSRHCIGSAITNEWVLTAGHCISKKLSHIEYGPDNSKYSRIISKHVNPGYRMDYSFGGYFGVLNDNIALVKGETMDLKQYGRLSARDYSSMVGEVVKYAGYGGVFIPKDTNKAAIDDPSNNTAKTNRRHNDERTPDDLRVGEGGIIRCEQERYIIFHPAICIAPKCGKRKDFTTQGDSGGPLTLDKRIIGLNSGHSLIMGDVFTPVSPFFEWISSTINKINKTNKHCSERNNC